MAKPLETEADIRNAAVALLARREYSRAELQRKLGGRVEDDAMLVRVLDQLEENGYQSDARFAEVFVRSRLSSGYGQMRIRQELQRKGIARERIAAVLDAQETDSRALARDCHQRRFGDRPVQDQKDYGKRMRFLVNRGFSFEDARHAIRCQGEETD
ncbi:regulatory protein RecX [Marinobacterium weihaiense]|uniref:Regulatory protein RecX n=1 Tax=Marinobacterium weihaiense TaxID=2851016 RepID=A0ABS6M8B0_9GAMM|nr:regulatory protein RecX [Marinobacterium weihaiense]MBV0932526.1 recombination regulator RecX [Marinobacterium weihaiense]